MCGIMPLRHCAASRVSSSLAARATLRCASPMEMNAVSQLHMCGYSRGAAVIIVPMSLPDRVHAALAASCTAPRFGLTRSPARLMSKL
jgi:hypothetical protein